jgi:ubiquinone/menaquinone biosynthesis C-methylase UbiE
MPYGNKGSDNRLCPNCLSLERHRLLWLFLQKKTNFFTANLKVLHIAPEQAFLSRFKKLSNMEYVTADLESPLADIKLDITQMPLPDNAFDVVICNHVLEHITDDNKAMREVLRVLKPNGWAILQVPLDISQTETYEDEKITDRQERELIFGQYDHVRVYGLDYKNRLVNAGFKVEKCEFVKEYSEAEINRFRFDKTESIYLCKK